MLAACLVVLVAQLQPSPAEAATDALEGTGTAEGLNLRPISRLLPPRSGGGRGSRGSRRGVRHLLEDQLQETHRHQAAHIAAGVPAESGVEPRSDGGAQALVGPVGQQVVDAQRTLLQSRTDSKPNERRRDGQGRRRERDGEGRRRRAEGDGK